MPNLIRNRDAVQGATMEDLDYTFRELRGQPDFVGFTTRAAAETQVHMAIMAAQDAAGRAGIPAGTKPPTLTARELAERMNAADNPYKDGTMSHALRAAIDKSPPIQPRPKAAEKPPAERTPKQTIDRVRATLEGTSRPQAGSMRSAVLQRIQESPERTASVKDLSAHFQVDVRGHIQKLIEKNHLTIVQGK